MKQKKVIVLLLIMALLISACSGGNTNTGNKTLRIAVNQPANSMNNVYSTEAANNNVIINFLEGLIVSDLDGKIQPAAAESYTVSDDKLVYTFKLRDNVWSNGDKVRAQDFVFSWQLSATEAKAGYKIYQTYLKNGTAVTKGELPKEELGIKALDEKTLEITLASPKTYFLDLLVQASLMPINEAFFESIGADTYGTTADTVLANGPYKLTDYTPDQGYRLEKRLDYWNAQNIDVDVIDAKVIKESSTRAIMWDNKEVDEVYLGADHVAKYEESENLQTEKDWSMYYMYLSPFTETPAPLLANYHFRAAVAHAIDKQLLADMVLKDGSVGSDYLIATGVKGKEGQSFREYSGLYQTPLFNVEKAKSFLDKAKSELGNTPLEINFTIDDAERNKKTFENIKGQLEQNLPGVTVKINTIPSQSYFPTLYEYKTPAARHGWTNSIDDPTTYFALFTSDTKYNFGKVNVPKYDELIQLSESEAAMRNPEQRLKYMKDAEEALLEQYYNIPLYQRGNKKLVTKGIKGLSYTSGRQNLQYRFVTMP